MAHSVFLSWTRHDQDMALALHHLEVEEESNRCSVCGGDKRECQNPDYQRAYAAEFGRCFRTRNVAQAMTGRKDDDQMQSLVVNTKLHPDRVRSKS